MIKYILLATVLLLLSSCNDVRVTCDTGYDSGWQHSVRIQDGSITMVIAPGYVNSGASVRKQLHGETCTYSYRTPAIPKE